MTLPRIADRDVAGTIDPASSGRRSTAGERFGAAIASPVGVMIVVPALVAAVGVFLTLIGQNALRESTTRLGRDRFVEQTSFIARSIASSLVQTDAVLDRLHELTLTWGQDAAPGPVAHGLRGLIQGRAGLSYASVSYPDGTFRAAYLDDGGTIRYQEVLPSPRGPRMSRYDLEGADGLVKRIEEESTYDPRERTFWRDAMAANGRVWTRPYPFFTSHHTGVTRTEPVRRADGSLVAVLTADLDVHALSVSMEHNPLPGARTLLYGRDGTLLAFPEGAAAIRKVPLSGEKPLALADLKDPVIDAFFASAHEGAFSELKVGGEDLLAMAVAVPGFPELGWNVAVIVPDSVFFRARKEHERQSVLAAAVSLLVALGLALVFAGHVVRVRREAAAARDQAREATERARELGSYRLVERLGAGGMGEVWRAEHRLLVRQAAVKLIRKEALIGARSDLRERFRKEAQTLATLKSRHTIQLYDFGVTEDGTFFFVMELLDGMDLDTLVKDHGPQPAGRVIQILLQTCSSLAEAHEHALVHRDIKPANVFVCRAADEVDFVKVLDFGLVQDWLDPALTPGGGVRAQDNVRLTQDGQLMGTPAFMTPEQILGHPTDARADIYALGCVGFWLLTGRMPFEGGGAMAVMAAHLKKPLPDAAAVAAMVPGHLPPELDAILRQCLAKSRDDRPRDVRTLSDALWAIPLPPEERWTPDRAREWWRDRVAKA